MLKLIFYIILFYLIFKVMVRYVFPFLVRLYLKSVRKKFYQQNPHYRQQQQQQRQKKRKDGEVTIEYMQHKQRQPSTDNVGEYVDYEDVEQEEK
ncbi:MAG: DUF4834 family protein [Bacteroidales bacterium]|nr:DUF4834 family protein [Bacteroidales bacterium]